MKEVLSDPVIEVQKLSVKYDKKTVLLNVDLRVPSGKLLGIVGPNGAGKSTFLKALVGLVEPASGSIRFFNGSFVENRRKVAYIPQRESVDWDFPASVWDVVMMGRDVRRSFWRWATERDRNLVQEALEQVGMWSLKARPIGSLSGGQQQRVFFARALAQQADVFLLDEPFSGMDALTQEALLTLLQDLVQNKGKTVLVVHHDLGTAKQCFDEIVLLNVQLIDFGSAAQVLTPEKLRAAYGVSLYVD